jgi:hypothetical protein
MTTTEAEQVMPPLRKGGFTPKEAQDIVVRWLSKGGRPNDDLDYKYNYVSSIAHEGCACAGAAIGLLVYGRPVDAQDVGERLYGDHHTFFILSIKGVRIHDPRSVAEYVSSLSPKDE